MQEPRFRADLYTGTAEYYDEFRLGYPRSLLHGLLRRARIGSGARLLDLACGTGQVAFGLHSRFADVWAVDQEEEAVAFGRAKAAQRGVRNITWVTGRAEDVDLDVPVDLVTIGNAFHRLRRRQVAAAAYRWLRPGGCLALLWSDPPWAGQAAWQKVLAEVIADWTARAWAQDRVPATWDKARRDEPDSAVLAGAGFDVLGRSAVTIAHTWTTRALTGFVLSTSLLSPPALGSAVPVFRADLARRLLQVDPGGRYHQDISYACDLARRPAPAPRTPPWR